MSTQAPSGAPLILRTARDWGAWIPVDVSRQFWPRAEKDRGKSWVISQQSALRNNNANIETAYVFRLVTVVQTQSGVAQIQPGGQVVQAGATYETAVPKSLEEANRWYAANLAAECPLDMVRRAAPDLGVRVDIDEQDMRAAVAFRWAEQATALGKSLPEIEKEFAETGGIIGPDGVRYSPPQGAAGVRGAGSIGRFFKDVGDWFRGVIIKNIARALISVGEQLVKWRNNSGFVGRFFFDALGITAQGVLLAELGHAALDGNISTFNEQRFGMAAGATFLAAGQVLVMIAPFLPVPFNLAAAALGALSIALGGFIQHSIAQEMRQREEERQIAELEKRQRQAAEQAELARLQAEEELAALEQAARDAEQAARDAELAGGVQTREIRQGAAPVGALAMVGGGVMGALAIAAALVFAFR